MQLLCPVTCALLVAVLCGHASPLFAQTLVGEKVAGAFVTMTKGAKCPATMTVTFISQGEASGVIDGVHDARGTIGLTLDEKTGVVTVSAFTSTFEINKTDLAGEMTWEAGDRKPLRISCDPLALRIDGELRYTVTRPFVETGIATVQISGARRVITNPYFGDAVITFSAPAPKDR